MKREKGFTLIELMVAIAILVIIVGMITPLMSSITRSNKKAQDVNELDLNIGKSIDVFKKAVRSSNDMANDFGGTRAAIYLSNDKNGDAVTGVTTTTAIVINVPKEKTGSTTEYDDEKVIFYFDAGNKKLMLNSTTNETGNFSTVTKPVELVNNVHEAHFGYENNIATIYMKVKLNKKGSDTDENNFKKVRDAAVTRININF